MIVKQRDYFRLAERYYKRKCPSLSLYDDVINLSMHGYYICSYDLILLAKPFIRGSDRCDIISTYHAFDIAKCDSIYINLFIGNINRAAGIIPDRYEYVSFERGDSIPRYYKIKTFKDKLYGSVRRSRRTR